MARTVGCEYFFLVLDPPPGTPFGGGGTIMFFPNLYMKDEEFRNL